MICDRKCGTDCPYFRLVDKKLIEFLTVTFPSENNPPEDGGTCDLDTTAKTRQTGDKCAFPNINARIDPED